MVEWYYLEFQIQSGWPNLKNLLMEIHTDLESFGILGP